MVDVRLLQYVDELLSVGVDNACFSPEHVPLIKLCEECQAAYFVPVWDAYSFVPVWDAYSTCGAETGEIVWPSGEHWWSMSVLPFDRPAVEDPDGDGVFDLIDRPPNSEQVGCTFERGLIARRPEWQAVTGRLCDARLGFGAAVLGGIGGRDTGGIIHRS